MLVHINRCRNLSRIRLQIVCNPSSVYYLVLKQAWQALFAMLSFVSSLNPTSILSSLLSSWSLHRGGHLTDALLVLVSSALPSAVCVLNPLFARAVVFSVINRCIYPPSKSCSRHTLVTVSTWGAKTCCHAPVKMMALH